MSLPHGAFPNLTWTVCYERRRLRNPRLGSLVAFDSRSKLYRTMNDNIAIFITWTTYGTWLPGDMRGWRRKGGNQIPQPLLVEWCRKRMTGEAVLLEPNDRRTIEEACHAHCNHRSWHLYAVNARTNHVHVVVAADMSPQKVRDQLKANCTAALRRQAQPLLLVRTWSKGGDCDILDTDDDVCAAVMYTSERRSEPTALADG